MTHAVRTSQALGDRLLAAPSLRVLALGGLCAAYIQGPLVKLFDFGGAVAEMAHFGLRPAPVFAAGVIVFELAASALVIAGVRRGPAALALAAFTLMATLIALRFWELPAGPARTGEMNAFFEHIGLAAAFVMVAAGDAGRRVPSGSRE